MTTKRVELSVLLSIINDCDILSVTTEQQADVVGFIHGNKTEKVNQEMFSLAAEFLKETYPKLAEAANLIARCMPDIERYKKLTDLFKMWHQIDTMESLQAA